MLDTANHGCLKLYVLRFHFSLLYVRFKLKGQLVRVRKRSCSRFKYPILLLEPQLEITQHIDKKKSGFSPQTWLEMSGCRMEKHFAATMIAENCPNIWLKISGFVATNTAANVPMSR